MDKMREIKFFRARKSLLLNPPFFKGFNIDPLTF